MNRLEGIIDRFYTSKHGEHDDITNIILRRSTLKFIIIRVCYFLERYIYANRLFLF